MYDKYMYMYLHVHTHTHVHDNYKFSAIKNFQGLKSVKEKRI